MRYCAYWLVLSSLLIVGCNRAEEARREVAKNNLKQIAKGLREYQETHESPASEFSHVITAETEYYTTGPQQGRPADGKFPAGTKVNVVEEAGSYILVRTDGRVDAYVASDVVSPAPAKHEPNSRSVQKPNIILLLADDLGYGDLGCYGAPDAKTAYIDQLAKDGVRFTQHYANGTECSPTRTALLTGRYQHRVGGLECAIGTGNVGRYDDAIRLAEQHRLGLPPNRAALPRLIKRAGYAAAIFGKWHLGYDAQFSPLNYGFDTFFGCLGGYVDYFTHRELSELPVLYRDRKATDRDGYMTQLITDEAVRYLGQHGDDPFFLYVPFTAPHFPFQGPGDENRETTAENLTQGSRDEYVRLIESLDQQIGRILQAVDDAGLRDNTYIVFASDHGAMRPGRNNPFSNFKSTVYEGGIRAPLIVRHPRRIKPGTVCRQTCITFDLTRSFVRLAGAEFPTDSPADGIDILAHVESEQPDASRTLFWRGRRGERVERAVRHGDWKYLHRRLDDGTIEEGLFDLAEDPGETQNQLAENTETTARLKRLLDTWEQDVRPER